MEMILWSISTLVGNWFAPVKKSNGGTMAVNESQIKNWMWQMVSGYMNFADGAWRVDTFNLARDAYIYFTGETDQAPHEYQTCAMSVANQKLNQMRTK